MGESVLQGNTKFIQFDRHNTDERTGKKALENINGSGLYACPAVLVLYGHIKYSHHRTRDKQRPPEQRKKPDRRLYPCKVKQISSHVAHICEKVRDRAVYSFVHPLQHGIPYGA